MIEHEQLAEHWEPLSESILKTKCSLSLEPFSGLFPHRWSQQFLQVCTMACVACGKDTYASDMLENSEAYQKRSLRTEAFGKLQRNLDQNTIKGLILHLSVL